MKRTTLSLAVIASGLLWLGTPTLAATKVSTVTGNLGTDEDTCFQSLVANVGEGENCMYDGGPSSIASIAPFGEVTGPFNHIAYYDSVTTPAAFVTTPSGLGRTLYAQVNGDGKIAQKINGSITIDDAGNGFGADDLLSFTITLTSPGTGAIIRHYSTSVVDKYDSMTQTLAPRTADSVAANGFGGLDYVIGTEGFPTLLTYSQAGVCFGLIFGSVECGHGFSAPPLPPPNLDPDYWNGVSAAGLGSLESNLGAKTTGTVVNLACIDTASTTTGVESNGCRVSQVALAPWVIGPCLTGASSGSCTGNESTPGSVRGNVEDVGWDQLLLKVSTNAVGNVVAVAGFTVEEYRIFNQTRCGDNTTGSGTYLLQCNSWTSGYFSGQSADSDGDGIQNSLDNCSSVANPTQLDANGDGYGNICDADINNSGTVTTADFGLLRSVLGQPAGSSATAAAADMNGSGTVTTADFGLLRARLGTVPGPSGLH